MYIDDDDNDDEVCSYCCCSPANTLTGLCCYSQKKNKNGRDYFSTSHHWPPVLIIGGFICTVAPLKLALPPTPGGKNGPIHGRVHPVVLPGPLQYSTSKELNCKQAASPVQEVLE